MAKNKKQYGVPKNAGASRNITKAVDPNRFAVQLNRLEALLEGHTLWIIAAVFVVSGFLNTQYYLQAKSTPLESMHKWDNNDMTFFDQSAKYIARGNWLCDTVLHPYHGWHDLYANKYFEQYPETATQYYSKHLNTAGIPDTMAARMAMINELFQGKVYHQEPLYVYLVAITYRLFGEDANWIFVWQLFLAALTNVLVFLVGRRYFGSLTGLLAAVLVMISGPVMVFGMTILRTTLTTFLTLLLTYTYQQMLDQNSRRSQLIFGAISGLALVSQSYFILFIIPALGWYAWIKRDNLKASAVGISLAFCAILLVLLPLFMRNIKVGVPMTSMASNGAITYILFNSSNASPLEPSFIHMQSTVKLMHDSGGKLAPAAIACLKSFDNLGALFTMYKQKLGGLFMWFEVPNNMSYYLYREFSPLLKLLPAPYFLLAPLGICGLLLGFWRLRRQFIPLFLMLLVSASPMFISSSLARYRTPFVILMTLLAAYCIVVLTQKLAQAELKKLVAGILLSVFAWYYTSSVREREYFPIYINDVMPIYVYHYMNRFMDLEKAGEKEKYIKLSTEFLGYLPDYFMEVQKSHKVRYSNEAQCCRAVSKFTDAHSKVLDAAGNKSESAKYQERTKILATLADDYYKRTGQ